MNAGRSRARLVEWVAASVMPHEPVVRAWLRRRLVPQDEIDELIQEGYCRMAAIETPELISNPGGFFLTTVRNLLATHRARRQVVRIDAMPDLDVLICPLLSGPKLMIFWMTKENMNAGQEASPGRDYRQAA